MRNWFVFNTVDSRDMGLYIEKMPEIVRPAERIEYKSVPGRPGSLSFREGVNVFDGYERSVTVYHLRSMPLNGVLRWLRGAGDIIFANEPDRAYIADLAAEIRFAPVDNDWEQAVVSFFVQPYKKQYPPEAAEAVADTLTVYNPGNLPARPLITVPALATGQTQGLISVNESRYEVYAGGLTIDCDAEVVRDANGLNMDAFDMSNGFPVLQPGDNAVAVEGFASAVTIAPRWRWI